MSAGDSLGRQFHEGFIHPRHLIPTELNQDARGQFMISMGPGAGPNSPGVKYQNNLTADIAEHGIKEPLNAYYSDRGEYGNGKKQKPKLYLQEGHHRLKAARTLGLERVPVKVSTTLGLGRPPELKDE